MTDGVGAVSAERTHADSLEDHLWERRFRTIYHVRVSILYHLKRERFFDLCDKFSSMAVALAATAAAVILLKKAGSEVEEWATLATAGLALVPLVVNPADKARKHAQSASEFRRLLAELERSGEYWTSEQCDQFGGRVVELETAEPSTLCALVIHCQNQLNGMFGKPDDRLHLRFYERWLMHWIDFDSASILARHAKEAKAIASGADAKPNQ